MIEKKIGVERDFRWRGEEVLRLEGLTDTAFGFALTLVVVSLEVPKTFDDLRNTLNNSGAFAVCLFALMALWRAHYVYFRRYGLEDRVTIILNTLYLLVVLLYVFPLKFLFTLIFRQFSGLSTDAMIRPEQSAELMIVYGIGYCAVFAILALMYYHAYRQRERLALTPLEQSMTFNSILSFGAQSLIALVSISIAAIGGPAWVTVAGFAYPVLAGILLTIINTYMGGRIGRQERAAKNESAP